MGLRLFVLASIAALAPSTAAAASWSAPVTRGPPAAAIYDPAIAFSADGQRLLSASFRPSIDYTPGQRLQTVALLFSGTTEVARTHLLAPPVAYGAARAAYLRESARDKDFPSRVAVGVSFGDLAGDVGPFHLLSRRALPSTPVIAANRRGTVAVAWAESGRLSDGRVRLAIRPARGRFGRPVTVASGLVGLPTSGTSPGDGLAVAVGASGEVVVAYQRERARSRTIEARIGSERGRLGSPQRLGPQRGLPELSAGIAPSGRAVVAWGSQDPGEEANEPYSVYAAIRSAGSARFATTQVLDPGGPAIRPFGRAALAVADDGSAVVAWSSPEGSYRAGIHRAVRVATAGPRGRFGPQRELAPSGAVGDVAVGAGGAAIVLWSQLVPEDEPRDVVAAVRASGAGDFGLPEAISPSEHAVTPVAAFDPHTGRPMAAWVALNEQGSTLRVAERSG
jgi:hypothetical protein